MDWETYYPRGGHDDWETETASYSPDKFYTKSTDGKGHSETIYLKIHPTLARLMAEIIQSREIPEYRTAQDLIRDAVVHRIHYLRSRLAEKKVTVLKRIEAIQNLLAHEEMMAQYQEVIERASAVVRQLLQDPVPGARDEARRIIRDLYGEIAGITDSPYWREKYLSRLAAEFGPLLEEEEE
jgi:hypothetical protein